MAKAKAHPNQLGFDFQSPRLPKGEAALAGLEARICRTVGIILASEHASGRPREVIAAEMTVLSGEKISVDTLNAMSSPARKDHKVAASRLLVLLAVTSRHDLFDPLLRETGAAVVCGDEVETVRIGHLEREIAMKTEELRRLKRTAPIIRTGGLGGKPGN